MVYFDYNEEFFMNNKNTQIKGTTRPTTSKEQASYRPARPTTTTKAPKPKK